MLKSDNEIIIKMRWENDNRWRDGITSFIKTTIETNNGMVRRPSPVLSVKKTVEGMLDVWKRCKVNRRVPYTF